MSIHLAILEEAHEEMLKSLFKSVYLNTVDGLKTGSAIENMRNGLERYQLVHDAIAKVLQEQP